MSEPITSSSEPNCDWKLDQTLTVGSHTLRSRLIVGTGKYDTNQLMKDSLLASGSDCVTVAVRREKMYTREGENILDLSTGNVTHFFPTRQDASMQRMQFASRG